MSEISDAIEDSATGPAEVSGDSGRVRQHPIGDLIEADKYTTARTAANAGPPWGLRFSRIVPPGAV